MDKLEVSEAKPTKAKKQRTQNRKRKSTAKTNRVKSSKGRGRTARAAGNGITPGDRMYVRDELESLRVDPVAKKGRMLGINPDLWRDYLAATHKREEDLRAYVRSYHSRVSKSRKEDYDGPDDSTFRRIKITGFGAPETYYGALEFFGKALKAAYDVDPELREEFPMLFRLDKYPIDPRKIRRSIERMKAEQISRYEYHSAIAEKINISHTPHVLYASIGAGFGLRELLLDNLNSDHPRIHAVVIRHMSEKVVKELMARKRLNPTFLRNLQRNIKLIKEHFEAKDRVKVVCLPWKDIPPFHGMMYDEDEVYSGYWVYGEVGLNTINTKLSRLTPVDGATFERVRDLLKGGYHEGRGRVTDRIA